MVSTTGNQAELKKTAEAPAQENPNTIKLKQHFREALDLDSWEKTKAFAKSAFGYSESDIARDIIKDRTPEQTVTAFEKAKPEWKDALSHIKSDPELSKALHSALVKDPTVLDGFAAMAADGNAAGPGELEKSLKDPAARKAMAFTLNKIADNPDDKYKFDDFKYLYDNRNNKVKSIAKLNEMGMPMTNMLDGNQMFTMLREAFMSPDGFQKLFAQLPSMMGLSGEQAAAMQQLCNGLGGFMDLCLGTRNEGFRGIANKYGDSAYIHGKDFVERISGQRDEEIARKMREAGTGEAVDPKNKKAMDSSKGEFNKAAENDPFKASPELRAEIDKVDKELVATRTVPHASPGLAAP